MNKLMWFCLSNACGMRSSPSCSYLACWARKNTYMGHVMPTNVELPKTPFSSGCPNVCSMPSIALLTISSASNS